MKKKYEVTVTYEVDVEVDESKFTDEFLTEYKKHFYNLHDIDDHMQHLSQYEARLGLGNFIEGYGKPESMGIKARVVDEYSTVEEL